MFNENLNDSAVLGLDSITILFPISRNPWFLSCHNVKLRSLSKNLMAKEEKSWDPSISPDNFVDTIQQNVSWVGEDEFC